jgi:hypothetical protein
MSYRRHHEHIEQAGVELQGLGLLAAFSLSPRPGRAAQPDRYGEGAQRRGPDERPVRIRTTGCTFSVNPASRTVPYSPKTGRSEGRGAVRVGKRWRSRCCAK